MDTVQGAPYLSIALVEDGNISNKKIVYLDTVIKNQYTNTVWENGIEFIETRTELSIYFVIELEDLKFKDTHSDQDFWAKYDSPVSFILGAKEPNIWYSTLHPLHIKKGCRRIYIRQ